MIYAPYIQQERSVWEEFHQCYGSIQFNAIIDQSLFFSITLVWDGIPWRMYLKHSKSIESWETKHWRISLALGLSFLKSSSSVYNILSERITSKGFSRLQQSQFLLSVSLFLTVILSTFFPSLALLLLLPLDNPPFINYF